MKRMEVCCTVRPREERVVAEAPPHAHPHGMLVPRHPEAAELPTGQDVWCGRLQVLLTIVKTLGPETTTGTLREGHDLNGGVDE